MCISSIDIYQEIAVKSQGLFPLWSLTWRPGGLEAGKRRGEM